MEISEIDELMDFMDNNEELKGKFLGYKDSRGFGVTRIDNDWYNCEEYFIRFKDFIEFISKEIKRREILARIDELENTNKYYDNGGGCEEYSDCFTVVDRFLDGRIKELKEQLGEI